VALLIHLLFLLLFWILATITPSIKESPKQEEKKIKISLKEMPEVAKDSGLVKEKIQPTEIAPPMPKGSQLKEIVKQAPIKYEPKKQPIKEPKLNKPAKQQPKPEPKPKIEPLPPEKPYIPLLEPKKDTVLKKEIKEQVKDPMAWMYEDKSSEQKTQEKPKSSAGSSINQNIKELYGEEFGKLSAAQQEYILDNQEIMRRITQQVLTRVARVNLPRDLNVNRSNVIEFYLHPNGDMTDFKFLEKSGYYVLDDTTKETIEYAYSRYPRPTEKTLIRYNVFYNLARY
jgi:outer membrane biosynthesis protein TonB